MRMYKLCAVLAAASLTLGLILCVFGFTLGGRLHDSFGIHYGDHDFSARYSDDEQNQEKTIPLSAFKKLEMDIDIGDITIKYGDEFMLYTDHPDIDDYEIIEKDDTLKIISHQKGFELFSIDFFQPDYHFILTIPKDGKLTSLTLASAMGDITISGIYAQDIQLNQAMGDISIEDTLYSTMNIDQKMGDVEYEGKGQGNMTIDNAMGDINVTIKDDIDNYTYELSTAMGSIETDRKKLSGASKNISNKPKNAKYKLIMDCSMGDIELEFDNDFD